MCARTQNDHTHIEWRERGRVSARAHKTSVHTHRVWERGGGVSVRAHKTIVDTHRVEAERKCHRGQTKRARAHIEWRE